MSEVRQINRQAFVEAQLSSFREGGLAVMDILIESVSEVLPDDRALSKDGLLRLLGEMREWVASTEVTP